jgi:hypothetical protein
MSFKIGDILFFDRYQFTDTGETKPHFGLVVLPEHATKYQGSVFCAVITSKQPKHWGLCLYKKYYSCFVRDSFACFDRKDLVSKDGLDLDMQPRGTLTVPDIKTAYRILRKSLFVIDDLGKSPFLRGVIIYEWKKIIALPKK